MQIKFEEVPPDHLSPSARRVVVVSVGDRVLGARRDAHVCHTASIPPINIASVEKHSLTYPKRPSAIVSPSNSNLAAHVRNTLTMSATSDALDVRVVSVGVLLGENGILRVGRARVRVCRVRR